MLLYNKTKYLASVNSLVYDFILIANITYMKKFLRVFFASLSVFILIVSIAFLVVFLTPPKIEFNSKKLMESGNFISFYDKRNSLVLSINENKKQSCKSEFSTTLKNAFIAVEDKNFYKHKGLDYKRIIKAALVNVKNMSFKQGASTISQQLVKNTHLTNEKTLSRKITEIKLTKILEKKFSKDEIITAYLNTIYFGENTFGIIDAAKHYFDKTVEELSLSETAVLAGIISAPTLYNPNTDLAAAKKRRNLVINKMYEQGYITSKERIDALNEKIETTKPDKEYIDSYIDACFNEIYEKTNLSPYSLNQCKVWTYYNDALQKTISSYESNSGYQAIILDNLSCGVCAYYTNVGELEREIASCAKPLYVYAPAIEENIITEHTKIDDSPIDFNGYSPKNYGNKYNGYVSAKEALSKSLNIPAVKILDALGVKKSKDYAKKLNIDITNDGLSIALGNTAKGIKLKNLASAYTTFANFGHYKTPRFIRQISDITGKIIYKEDKSERKVFSPSTSSMITDMLCETVKSGTAKKLSYLPFQLACKTGTNGDDKGNFDCYSVGYSVSNTVACWIGNKDYSRLPLSETGSGTPTYLLGDFFEKINACNPQPNFVYKDLREVAIDKISYENSGELLIADDNTPDRYTLKIYLKNDYPTLNHSTRFTTSEVYDIKANFNENKVSFTLDLPAYITYKLYRVKDKKSILIHEGHDSFVDNLTLSGIYDYYAVFVIKGKNSVKTKPVKIVSVNFSDTATPNEDNDVTPPDSWWID